MAEQMEFPLFSNCKLTISSKVSTSDGKLFKLITDKLQFKIIGFDPLVIEKDCLSQQDMLQLCDIVNSFREPQDTSHQTLKQHKYFNMNNVTTDFHAPHVAQTTTATGKSQMILEKPQVIEQHEESSENEEIPHSQIRRQINENNTDRQLLDSVASLDQNGSKYESDKQTAPQSMSVYHSCISQEETASFEFDEKLPEKCIFSMKASSFNVAKSYFYKSDFKPYFDNAECEGSGFMFKLNVHNKKDVEFIEQLKKLEFDELDLVHEDRVYVRSVVVEIMSEINGLNLDIVGRKIHIIGSKDVVASTRKRLVSLLQSQNMTTYMSSDHLQRENNNTSQTSVRSEELTLDIKRNLVTHESEIMENEATYRMKISQDLQHPAKEQQSFKSLDEHENSPGSTTTGSYSLAHSDSVSAFCDAQNGSCLVSSKSKLKVKVHKANITKLEVDCIVNAANEYLQHIGGVAKAIAEAAGPALRKECEDYIKAGNFVAVTDNFVSTGGKLPAKYVMHAVGPKWDSYDEKNKSQCLDDLRYTVLRCLVEAGRRSITSIALPSISAAIGRVPYDLCAICYMEAVKHFDIIAAGEKSSLLEIHFVDVDDTLVDLIRDCFSSSWSKPCDLEIAQKDNYFVKKDLYSKNEAINFNRKSSLEQKFSDFKTHQSSSPTLTREQAIASVLESADNFEMGVAYHIGKVTLQFDNGSAFDHATDITITVGKCFDKLSGVPDFRISNVKQSKGVRNKENGYEFFSVPNPNYRQSHLLCEVYPEPDKVDQIAEAFKNLETVMQIQYMKKLVLTSSILYAESTNTKHEGEKDIIQRKKVGKFAQCLYSYLEKVSKDTENSICFTVVGSEDALLTVIKVVESYGVKKITSESEKTASSEKTVPGSGKTASRHENTLIEGKASGSEKTVSSGDKMKLNSDFDTAEDLEIVCEFCCENRHCLPIICCRKLLCLNCEQSASACPFCSTFWRIIKGDQPPGYMTVSQIGDYVGGYEKINTWKIDYHFPSGIQKVYHPSPGKTYDSIKRTAYLPANIHGLQVLMLLRLSFIRGLTFTIGHSVKRGKDDVIIWNISHKTSLHGGIYGYPDPNYLDQVTLELASKGVKLEVLTESEKRQLAKFRSCITTLKSFSDI